MVSAGAGVPRSGPRCPVIGGGTIRNFVLVLLLGITSGTYSSIFNASCLLVVWENGDGSMSDIFGQRYNLERIPGDVDGDGVVSVSDVFYLINFLFAGGPAPV